MSSDTDTVPTPAPPTRRRRVDLGTFGLVGPPVVWLVVFFVVPVIIAGAFSVGILAFFQDEAAFSLDGWIDFLDGSAYLHLFWKSARMSLIVSVIAVLLAYPVAYFMALCAPKRKYVLLLMIIAPFFVSYFLRLLAMKVILGDQGVINSLAYWLGLRDPDDPIPALIYSQPAVIITLVFVYVPLVALPIFVVLENLDRRLLEAATDLGASRLTAFRAVTLPLSLPGVLAGFIFVFVPTLGEYFTPLLVGGTGGFMFGNSIADLYGPSLDWQTGSVLSIFLLAVIALLMVLFGLAGRFLAFRSAPTG
ncbi:ABC transporter permease [Gaiella sp.]|uniref:ABC transporter permease n=1 Tax=Gaiella sp. TaxID=2663207 RepID=UPI0032650DF8